MWAFRKNRLQIGSLNQFGEHARPHAPVRPGRALLVYAVPRTQPSGRSCHGEPVRAPQYRLDEQAVVSGGDAAITDLTRNHPFNALEWGIAKHQPGYCSNAINALEP